MPLQNRVDPYGRLHTVAARGTMMGNRGVLHDDAKRLVAPWRTRRWICCVLEFRGRHREVFAPRRYSELFFLDEATALAAGHRPCAECRRPRYEEFRAAWARGRRPRESRVPVADDIDRVLHEERSPRDGSAKGFGARLATLPPGVIVELQGRPWLVLGDALTPWSFDGYGQAVAAGSETLTRVLTPRSIVRAIRAGFVPGMHESARRLAAR